jgi:hypothetical protein
MDYECERCGHKTQRLGDLKKHFQRKKECEPLQQNIALKILFNKFFREEEKVEKGSKKYKCELCDKQFTFAQSKYVHKKHCTEKHKDVQIEKLDMIVKEQQKKLEQLEISFAFTQNNIKTTDNSQYSHNNITDNSQNVHIHINAFGHENTDYITQSPDYKKFMTRCLMNQINGLCEYIVKKHFDENHPENHNIRKSNKKDKIIDCYDGTQWIPKLSNEFLKKLIFKIEKDFSNFTDSLSKQETEGRRASLEAFMRKVGGALEWNISNDYFEFDIELEEDDKEKMMNNIYMLACEYIYRQTNLLVPSTE